MTTICFQMTRGGHYYDNKEERNLQKTSEVQSKMIIMGHQISSCHVPVVRSFSSCKRYCYHLEIFHMIIFLNILISSSIIPKSDLVLSHNSSHDVPISTPLVPKSHIAMSHNSSYSDPKSISPVPRSHLVQSHILSCYDNNAGITVRIIAWASEKVMTNVQRMRVIQSFIWLEL